MGSQEFRKVIIVHPQGTMIVCQNFLVVEQEKIRESPKSEGFVFWEPQTSVQKFTAIH